VNPDKPEEKFIPQERGSLPRVLLLDFNPKVKEELEKSKFQIFEGKSGFVDGIQNFLRDSSEIEIIFWDISACNFDNYEEIDWNRLRNKLFQPPQNSIKSSENDTIQISKKSLYDYFKQIRKKGGFIGVFLGNEYIDRDSSEKLSLILGLSDFPCRKARAFSTYGFYLSNRYAQNITLNKKTEYDLFYNFFNRFVHYDDLKFIINWMSAVFSNDMEGYVEEEQKEIKIARFYFDDEDNNHYAVFAYDQILISPKIRKLSDAILCLLQDILPNICNTEIYPDLQTFRWLQDNFFKPHKVKKEEIEFSLFKKDYEKNLLAREEKIKNIENQYTYLHKMLYSDDSDLFKKSEKLKDIVKQILEQDLKFKKVIDMDKEREIQGLALKEDLRIGDKILIEVKGTEKGAKASWIKEFRAHAFQYCSASDIVIKDLKLVLIFNHERRKDPRERSRPFDNDPELLKSCKSENILFIPVFELYKMIMDVKEGYFTEDSGREIIRQSKGLFEYTRKHENK